MSELHPSQLHQYLQMYARAKWSFWGGLLVGGGLFFLGASQKPNIKPWVLGASVATLEVGRRHRQTAKLLSESLGDIDRASQLNFQAWVKAQTQPTAQLALTVGSIDVNWKPENLTSLLDAIAGKQVRIVAPSGAGKSTIAQYLAYSIGGKVKIYEPEGTPEDWQGLEVVGKGEDWTAINQAMAEDLLDLSSQLKTRTEKGDSALAGSDRVYIGEEYPEVRTKCPTADEWLERHARRGRKGKRFLILLSQFDKVAAWGLEGKSDLIDCFRCIRLGKIAIKHAESLGDDKLVQWLKADSFGRCMIDDEPCQLPAYELMKAVATGKAEPAIDKKIGVTGDELLATFEYPERDIVELGLKHQGEWLPAWKCHNLDRSLRTISLEDIRLMFHGFASRGIGEVKDEKGHTHWRIDQQHLDKL
ncbi:hypothetical protein H6G93_33005 [Nostoc sp. FACHB-973]|nr:hypothetical protein [Nostoc sp. FACHB-973]